MRINRQTIRVAALLVIALAAIAILPSILPNPDDGVKEGPWTIIWEPGDVTSMVPVGDTLWVGGKLGVVGINLHSHEIVNFPSEEKLSYVRHMVLDGGDLLIGHDNGLTVYDGSKSVTYRAKDGLVDGRVNHILRSGDGSLWVGTGQGAYYRSNGTWSRFTTAEGLLSDQVNVMLEDGEGGLWFGSDVAPLGGISVLRDGAWSYFTTGNGLPHNDVNSLYLDVDGSVWAATGLLDIGGAVHFVNNGGSWVISDVLDVKSGLPEGKVRSIYRDSSGVLWIGSENKGLARLEKGVIQVFTEAQGLSHEEVKVLWTDPDGYLWLGTRNGVTVLSPDDQRLLVIK